MSAYDGNVAHVHPVVVWAFGLLPSSSSLWQVFAVFIAADVLIAFALRRIALSKEFGSERASRSSVVSSELFPDVVFALYLFSPLSIASCVARSIDVFANVFVVFSLLGAATPGVFGAVLSGASLAVSSSVGVYPVVLAAPLFLLLRGFRRRMWAAISFTVCAVAMVFAGFAIEGGSWQWLRSFYWFILTAPDMSPNIGLWWYLFCELFTHFTTFFTIVFQINTVVYAVPLAIRFRDHALLVFWALCATTLAMFQPYPSLAHVGLQLSLLPFVWHEVRSTRYTFSVVLVALTLVVLLPNATRAWLLTGTGNVNFYYFATMALQIAQLLFVSDCLSEVLKREFLTKHPPAVATIPPSS